MYKYMDEVEINISGIKDIKMIHFYHLMKESKLLSAAMVQFDTDKMINLCSLDKHYDEFISMIFMMYERENGKRSIIMDAYTKSVLDGMMGVDTAGYEKFMADAELLEKPLFYHQSYMPYIAVPVIKYVIEEMYSVAGKKMFWNPIEPVWFGKGTLSASFESGEKQIFPYVLACEDAGKYSVFVGNFFEDRYSLDMNINYDRDGIRIKAVSKSAGALGNMEFVIDTEAGDVITHCDITLKGTPVYNSNDALKPQSKWQTAEKIDGVCGYREENTTYFKLPWGQYIALEKQNKTEGDTFINSFRIGYNAFSEERNNALIHSFDEVGSIQDNTKYIINDGGLDIFEEKVFGKDIQIYCLPCGFRTRGFYKDKMADRYFKVKM